MMLSARPFRNRGFTLAELMVSLTILAMVGAGMASMLATVSQGTTTQNSARRVAVKRRVVAGRIDAAVRSSCRVLALRGDAIVLWIGDARANGLPDLSELRRIEWQRSTDEVWMYVAPPGLPENRDVTFALNDDFERLTRRRRNTSTFPGQRWGRGVVAWSASLDERVPQAASLVSYTIDVRGDDGTASTAAREIALRGCRP